CTSRYRLEPHHIVLRSDGGTHDPENLTTLCWFHHHVAVHQQGFRIDPNSPALCRRLIRTPVGPDPP
ncbi:MAG: HNH endonuclease, partial [Actinomycetota bacterium]|nr:HNH endonuclease [Actinomycetota bacterium]